MTPIEACDLFEFEDKPSECSRYGNGHINDTYLIRCEKNRVAGYILQKVHSSIFRDPAGLMDNIQKVTSYLRDRIMEQGGDPMRETMNLVPTRNGRNYTEDENGDIWRAYVFIDHASCYDRVERPEDFYQSAYAFGRFQNLLSDFDASTLTETIPDFHNTPVRFERFKSVAAKDVLDRAADTADEIRFCMDRAGDMSICTDMLLDGRLPLRVTHNDTKLNNVLIDEATGKGLCVIDLDTVMPGLSVNDFGDSIRFGANTAVEDETDLSKVGLDLNLFRTYTEGFLAGCGDRLTETELQMLPAASKLMTLECGMRFLTDYLEGDIYFKTHRPHHNLDRARCQFALVADMERKMDDMKEIVDGY